ncbi:pentapeptide repeat-containing protein [Nostocaceae cyanobacterium CENA369]|uniref:Pentapeptide repeat-containing protein n=1 Tax=Dendronalium phyllosphericum CENA369 TaxID=1725256 RepID=A0A8J7LEQ8_9NOST|nr:pentapeptide repeat-containing protein [Dendronalium phyllosphericum]MBH8573034.1 pentapeptide repeat-containing protein [Dendronalium phyllosphericum CENA369]
MANEEHLAILRQGVEVWNEWRNKYPKVRPDLSGAKLNNANLRKANFEETNFSGAELCGANLHDAYLHKAILSSNKYQDTKLIETDLSKATLNDAKLVAADLTKANLTQTYLINTNFNGATLIDINLKKAFVSDTNFSLTNLKGTNLSNISLTGTNFEEADLREANFSKTNLYRSNLRKADLAKANLFEADLTQTSLYDANLRGACLTGSCIKDWGINAFTNLDAIVCDYIYLDQKQQERRPNSGNFAPGEFAKLFQKSLETVDLIFRNGIDWDAFAYSFKKVEVENQSTYPIVTTIELISDGIVLVKIAVTPDADKAKIHNEFMQGYEFAAKVLEAQYQARLQDKDAVIVRQEAQINRLFDIVEQQGSVQKALTENPRKISNTNIINSKFAGGMVDAINVDAQQIGGNIQNKDTEDFSS